MFIAQIGEYKLHITNDHVEAQQSYSCEMFRAGCLLQKKLKPHSDFGIDAAYIFVGVYSGILPD